MQSQNLSRTVLILLLLTAPVAAQRLDRPARELLMEARLTVLVEPVDPREPSRLRVVEVLRGMGVQRGDVLEGSQLAAALKDEQGPDWANLRQAVLFGAPGEKATDPFRLLPTGVRLVTQADRTWYAESQPAGGFRLVPHPTVTWIPLLTQLRADSAALTALEELRKQPASPQRNRHLIAWMDRHPPGRILAPGPLDPRQPPADLGESGWAELETAPVRWVLESGQAKDSWDALSLFARQHDGALAGRDCHAFATPEGRALLLAKASQADALEGDSLRALRMLAWAETYPLKPVATASFAKPLSEEEQRTLAEGLKPLLAREKPRWTQEVTRALVALVRGRDQTPETLRTTLAEAMAAPLKAAKPGNTRNALAQARHRLTADRQPLALLLDLGRRDNRLHFWLAVLPEGGIVTEPPSLLLESVAADGKTTEILKQPLAPVSPPDWKTGWNTSRPLYVELPLRKLVVGANYRLTVSGVVGPDKTPFTSEPRTFQATAMNLAAGQPWILSMGQIVLDEE